MSFRITVVLEYPSPGDAPRIGLGTTDFGAFKVHACQFSNALREIEVLRGHLTTAQLRRADAELECTP